MIPKRFFLLTLICFCLHMGLKAEIRKFNYKQKSISIHKWEVVDLVFTSRKQVQNPFLTDFSANFTSPSGTIKKVNGFYNGKNSWIIRFSAAEPGNWIYTSESELSSLNGKSGKLTVDKEVKNNSNGAIIIDPQHPHKFTYENGKPYFLTAFECDWLYALDYKNSQDLPKTTHLLDLLGKNGFNQVIMNVFSYDVRWKKDEKLKQHPEHEYGGPKDVFPFLGNNDQPDYSRLNVEFFQKLDRSIDLLNEKNIASHLMIYVWNKLVAWPDMYSQADNMYFDYVVKRYGAFPNIIWDISKEALYYGRADDKYILERIARLRKANTFQRLITVHDYGFCKRYPDSVDFISRQDWTYSLYHNMLGDYSKFKNKPVFNIEHGGYEESPYRVFEGSYTDAKTCLRRNYQCIFGGGYSTYYWQASSWNVIIHNPYEQEADFIKPKFEYFKTLTKLFTDYNFNEFEPSPWNNQAGYCLKGKDAYLFYVPAETYSYRAAFLFKESKSIKYRWLNTITGEYTDWKMANKQQDFQSPWYQREDAVLIVKH